jgi:hypothetical protein
MTLFVSVRTTRHAVEWLEDFRRVIADIPEIVEAWRLTGEVDYLLRIVVPDVDAYDAGYKRLINRLEFADISSAIAMEEMKFTTAIRQTICCADNRILLSRNSKTSVERLHGAKPNPEQTENGRDDRSNRGGRAEDDRGDGIEQSFGQLRHRACCNDHGAAVSSAAVGCWPDRSLWRIHDGRVPMR